MGNCSLKGVGIGECHNSIRVLTDSGVVLEFKGPITARDILDDHPGYGIFRQGHASSPLQDLECLISGRLYYLLPLVSKEQVQNMGVIEQLEAEWMSVTEAAKKSSDFVDNLANGSALEVLPSVGDGVWRVKLVIDTKQLEEILSEQVNTEALIEKMRMAASSASLTPKRTKSAWGMSWKPTLFNVFKLPLDNGK
ncbi:hypothetical protein FCV25MIE_25806 [Fagus crenata]|jgi:hypothetical protein